MSVADFANWYNGMDGHTGLDVFAPPPRKPKGPVPLAWQEDPHDVLATLGFGHKAPPLRVSHDMLRRMADQDVVVAAVHEAIMTVITNFMRIPKSPYDIGFEIVHKEKPPKEYSTHDHSRIKQLQEWVLNCGYKDGDLRRPKARVFVRKVLDNLLTYDAGVWEITQRRDGTPHSFRHVPGETIFHAPPLRASHHLTQREQKTRAAYVQVVKEVPIQSWLEHQMAYTCLRPRTTMFGYGYGTPYLETLINTVSGHLFAEQYNMGIFKNGSLIPGVLNVQGNPGKKKFQQFQRQWIATAKGVRNSHKVVVTNTPGLDWIPMRMSNTEMGFDAWVEYLVQLICAIYGITPEFVGLALKRRSGNSGKTDDDKLTTEAIKFAKDKCIKPILYTLEDEYNSDKMLGALDGRYRLRFYGINPKDEERDQKLKQTNLQHSITLNEDREERNLPPLPHGDIPLNPVYMGYLAQKEAAAMLQEQAPAEAHTSQGRKAPSNQEEIRNNADPQGEQKALDELRKSRLNRVVSLAEGSLQRGLSHTPSGWDGYDLSP